jgi:hypothetical protein
MMLVNRNEEYFVIILLTVVSPSLRAMHSHVLQHGYLGRRIFISIGPPMLCLLTGPTGKLTVVSIV